VIRKKPSLTILVWAASWALALSGCANVQRAKAQVDAATDRFHEQFNRGLFGAIYAAADADFRKTGTAQQLETFLEPYRTRLGPFQSIARPVAWTLARTSTGNLVSVTAESTFAHGSAREVFVWRVSRAQCALLKYTIYNDRMSTRAQVATAKPATRPVRFMPIHASLAHLEDLQRYYQGQLALDSQILPELTTDRAAWTAERRQWSAEGLAEQVRTSVGNVDAVVIGVTGEDIYLRSSNWRFAFGWRSDNRVAIVSYARMDPRFFKEPENLELLRRRLRHMVTKDLGVMLYELEMSPDADSPMYRDIGGIEELDSMGEGLALAGFPVVTR
jgi:predicted Zn-dependent protease